MQWRIHVKTSYNSDLEIGYHITKFFIEIDSTKKSKKKICDSVPYF